MSALAHRLSYAALGVALLASSATRLPHRDADDGCSQLEERL